VKLAFGFFGVDISAFIDLLFIFLFPVVVSPLPKLCLVILVFEEVFFDLSCSISVFHFVQFLFGSASGLRVDVDVLVVDSVIFVVIEFVDALVVSLGVFDEVLALLLALGNQIVIFDVFLGLDCFAFGLLEDVLVSS
jgi:hypothetical protein